MTLDNGHRLLFTDQRRFGTGVVLDGAAPAKPCPKTGQPMEFDELDSYFYFLQRFA